MDAKTDRESLAELVTRGGVYHGVSGNYPQEILSNMINLLPVLACFKTETLQRKAALLQAVLEREALITTGIGRGIALPHPRTPLLGEGEDPFVAIAFPVQPLDWNTLDSSKVHTIFLIVSESAKQHLGVLSKINFLCQKEKFYSLIKTQAPKEKIIAAIRDAETEWEKAAHRG